MAHTLIIGMTESGKTTLAKKLCEHYRRKGVKSVVLDPLNDCWPCSYQTTSKEDFLQVVSNPETQNCALFIDESGESIGQYNKEMFWLATRARHHGHNSHFIVQRVKQISPTVRGQCRFLYMFNSPFTDCKELSSDFNEPRLMQAVDLPQGYCLFCQRMAKEKFEKLYVF